MPSIGFVTKQKDGNFKGQLRMGRLFLAPQIKIQGLGVMTEVWLGPGGFRHCEASSGGNQHVHEHAVAHPSITRQLRLCLIKTCLELYWSHALRVSQIHHVKVFSPVASQHVCRCRLRQYFQVAWADDLPHHDLKSRPPGNL
jgi:hypothetical protein